MASAPLKPASFLPFLPVKVESALLRRVKHHIARAHRQQAVPATRGTETSTWAPTASDRSFVQGPSSEGQDLKLCLMRDSLHLVLM